MRSMRRWRNLEASEEINMSNDMKRKNEEQINMIGDEIDKLEPTTRKKRIRVVELRQLPPIFVRADPSNFSRLVQQFTGFIDTHGQGGAPPSNSSSSSTSSHDQVNRSSTAIPGEIPGMSDDGCDDVIHPFIFKTSDSLSLSFGMDEGTCSQRIDPSTSSSGDICPPSASLLTYGEVQDELFLYSIPGHDAYDPLQQQNSIRNEELMISCCCFCSCCFPCYCSAACAAAKGPDDLPSYFSDLNHQLVDFYSLS